MRKRQGAKEMEFISMCFPSGAQFQKILQGLFILRENALLDPKGL
jgi:hypothetical protein